MRATLKSMIILGALLAFGLSAGLVHAKNVDAGTFYITPKVGIYANSNSRISSMFSYGAEAGFFMIDGLSLGLEGLGYVVTQKRYPVSSLNTYETVNAFSPIGIFRYHFVPSDRFTAFVGLGLGGFFSNVNVPRNGATSSLTEVAEVGFTVGLTDILSLQLAGRYQHIGEFSNQGADNWGGNLGLKVGF